MRIFTLNKAIDEETLIKRCVKREHKAQKALYDQFASKMMGVCRRYLSNLEEAEEALSNGFIKVFTNLEGYESKGSFEGWIRKIMVRECLMYIRSKKTFVEYTDQIEKHDTQIAFGADLELDKEELMTLIDELPDGYRTVFNMYAIEGYKHQEIATMLNISESTSKTQLLRARKLLQTKIEELEKSLKELSRL